MTWDYRIYTQYTIVTRDLWRLKEGRFIRYKMPSITRRKRQREEEDNDQPRIYNWIGEGTIRDGAIHYKYDNVLCNGL